MKRSLLAVIAVLLCRSVIAMTCLAESFPSSVGLSWSPVEGAVYYDIYNGNVPVARLSSSELSYVVTKLPPHTDFRFCVAARDGSNTNLDSKWVSATTSGWDGVYYWENLTDNDNDGLVKDMKFRVVSKTDPGIGPYLEIWSYDANGDEYRIFPLQDLAAASGEWVQYKGSSPEAVAYRNNAERFNTSPFKPGKWRLEKLVIDYDSTSAYIQTSAIGMKLDTVSTYQFFIEDGVRKLSFTTTSDSSLVRKYLFDNPNPGEGPAYILVEI